MAEHKSTTLADVARERHQAQPARELDPWNDGPEPYTDTPMSPERAALLDAWLPGPPPAPQPIPVDAPAAHSFTTIRTAHLLDALTDAIDTIRASTAVHNGPWMKALDRAWDRILQLDELEYDVQARAWRVESASEPGRCYTANGDCQCAAFTKGAGICWHRAGARLIARALELRDLAEELIAEARDAGEGWYGEREARAGAKWRIGELTGVAADWDAMAAQARAMGRAA